MKKLTLSFALVCAITLAFSAPAIDSLDREITRIMRASGPLNLAKSGITNLDHIQPGQKFYLHFSNGSDTIITVKDGDTGRKIAAAVLASEKINGKVAAPTSPVNVEGKDAITIPAVSSETPWGWIVAALLLIAMAVYAAVSYRKREASKDPIYSGFPMKEGGVTDAEAPAYAREVAARTFNRPNLDVTNITKGTLSGTNVEVYYRGETKPQRRTFNNFDAYQGQVRVDGTDQFIYFLQGCGNDARIGNYFSGQDIRFVADTVAQTAAVATTAVATTEAAAPVPSAQLPSESMATLTETIKAIVAPMNGATTGKLKIKGNGLEIEMEFGKTPLSLAVNNNHVAHATEDVVQN
ncbi:MAG: hypothetical protein V4478_00090 [Patescibacteria group bacterium]